MITTQTYYEMLNRNGKVINQSLTYEGICKTALLQKEWNKPIKGRKVVKTIYSDTLPKVMIERETILSFNN